MPATRLDAGSCTDRWAGHAAVPADPAAGRAGAPTFCVRQRALQWGYLVAWFGLLFVVSPFLLRPEDWLEKLWLSAAFLCLVVYAHVSTYTAVQPDGLPLGRWLRRTSIPWSSVTRVEVGGRWIRRVYVVCTDATFVLPAPTSGPLNWDRRFQARAAAVQAAARQAMRSAAAGQSASARPDDPAPVPRPRTPAE